MASKQFNWFGALQMQLTVEKYERFMVWSIKMLTIQMKHVKTQSGKLYNPGICL
jgi:hypothetical protein